MFDGGATVAAEINKNKIAAVMGTTASGKSTLAVSLSLRFDGEVVSCDSEQIYRGPSIATAKISPSETKGVPHHLFDFVDSCLDYSCADFRADAEKAIRGILSRGKLPVLCGGTGLYFDSLLRPGEISPHVPNEIRERLAALDPDDLWSRLISVDPESAAKTHRNNVRRVIRALEIFEGTGVTKTEWDRRSREGTGKYYPLVIIITYRDRARLYETIDRRVDDMVRSGLFEELEKWDLPRNCPAAGAIGCREGYLVIDGKMSPSDGIAEIKKNTRHYAKRQLTWFSESRYPGAVRLYADEKSPEELFEAASLAVADFLN